MESAIDQVAADAIADAMSKAAEMKKEKDGEAGKALEPIRLRCSRYSYAHKQLYRVYDKPGHFSLIEASSAHEAYAKSGVASAVKIERESFFTQVAIASDLVEASDDELELDARLPDEASSKGLFVDLQSLDAQLEASVKQFEAMDLGALLRDNGADKMRNAAPVAEPEALEQEAESLLGVETEEELAESMQMQQTAPADAQPQEADRALTAREVNDLLASSDDA